MGTITAQPPDLNHRVAFMTQLFSDLQVARFNERYYQIRAAQDRARASWMSILAAISSCGALAAILNALPPIAGVNVGPGAAAVLTVVAAICAAVNPLFGWDAKAARLEQAAFGHGVVREHIRHLLVDLKFSHVEAIHRARAEEIHGFRVSLAGFDEPGVPSVIERAWEETMREYPSEAAWAIA